MCVCDRADIALVAESGAHASCCKLAFAPPVGSRVCAAKQQATPGEGATCLRYRRTTVRIDRLADIAY